MDESRVAFAMQYQAFTDLSRSSDSNDRGHAAHLAALAYLDHSGPADEHAALYAALIGFLDDSSVKVRAALAYGLLHSCDAPRPVILALLNDSPVISRTIMQYSPVLVDADLLPMARSGDSSALLAIAQRTALSARIVAALVARENRDITLRLLRRSDAPFSADLLERLAAQHGRDAELRGGLLGRRDLPPSARLSLVRCVTESLRDCRLVKGSLAKDRLERVLRDGNDVAASSIGEARSGDARFIGQLVETNQLSTRLLLHALVTGRVMFFSACLAALGQVSAEKVFVLLESNSRAALNALFLRCGIEPVIARLFVRMVMHARSVDLSDDLAARHYIVTALTEELLAEYEGAIPPELEEAFTYLSEQNVVLARQAARGVMHAFAQNHNGALRLPLSAEPALQLPAA